MPEMEAEPEPDAATVAGRGSVLGHLNEPRRLRFRVVGFGVLGFRV